MRWVVFPGPSVVALLQSDQLRSWVANQLPDQLDEHFSVEMNGTGYVGKTVAIRDQNVIVVALWPRDDLSAMNVRDGSLISIWSDPKESTVWTVDEVRAEVLERLCQLAQRAWENLTFPAHWEPKKVEGYPSIFAGDRQLKDLRVAYSVRKVLERVIVDVGTLYYARRNQKRIDVPAMAPDLLARLPGLVEPPQITPATSDRTVRPYASPTSSHEERDVRLEAPEASRHLFSLSYAEWVGESGPLTRQQRRVINHNIRRPLRIHGPAGSGKTLILILKALRLLREAQGKDQICHVLFVLHNNAIKSTVRAAIEAMDDKFFLATTRSDPHYLDVDTLHGWCIRELGLGYGPRYVLDTDPEASRVEQQRILADVVEKVLSDTYRLEGVRESLSPDFVVHLEGDRGTLLRNIRYEIAIRIKGKGLSRSNRDQYVRGDGHSFIGRGEKEYDRHFIFNIYDQYQERFEEEGLLDTDDVVLSLSARLKAPQWNVQRRDMGFDYILIDETHLFNENERLALPYLTRGTVAYPPLIMTFDEAQSIGGQRSVGLATMGITESDKEVLSSVHRSSPDILALARDIVERGPLMFSEFNSGESVAMMATRELRRSRKPFLVHAQGDERIVGEIVKQCNELRSENFHRVGVIVFDDQLLLRAMSSFRDISGNVNYVKERGEQLAAAPRPGVYFMTPETSGGLEFDAVILAGVDEGRVPPSLVGLSPHGYMFVEEEAFKMLYTAVTRARFRLIFISDAERGLSPLLHQSVSGGLIEEQRPRRNR